MSIDNRITCSQLAQQLKRHIPPRDPQAPRALKDQRSRALYFIRWLSTNGSFFNKQCLLDYQDYLQNHRRLKNSSIRAHLASVRSWLREISSTQDFVAPLIVTQLKDPLATAEGWLPANRTTWGTRRILPTEPSIDPVDPKKSTIFEIETAFQRHHAESWPGGEQLKWSRAQGPEAMEELYRIILTNQMDATLLVEQLRQSIEQELRVIPLNDSESADGFSPTQRQVQALLDQLNLATLRGLRDAAVIATMMFLGVRQSEIGQLDVEDVLTPSGEPARQVLMIPEKQGCSAREIPYDGLEDVHRLILRWIDAAQIEQGPLFRGFYRGSSRVRLERLSARSIEQILRDYPVPMAGTQYVLKPLELRRFAARQFAQTGLSLETLRQRLGVAKVQTVLAYLHHDFPQQLRRNKPLQFRLQSLKGYA